MTSGRREMTSTVLHGLDDADIPEEFTDELLIAVGDEVMARPAVLLNALLLAGWTPPSNRPEVAEPVCETCEDAPGWYELDPCPRCRKRPEAWRPNRSQQ